jgi:hypothetical protein
MNIERMRCDEIVNPIFVYTNLISTLTTSDDLVSIESVNNIGPDSNESCDGGWWVVGDGSKGV